MMSQAEWQEQNTKYLAASIASVRARLTALAGPDRSTSQAPPSAPAAEPEPAGSRPFWKRTAPKAAASAMVVTQSLPPASEQAPLPATVADQMSPPPALATLAARLRLSRFEQDILLLCTAMELDTGIAGLCGRVQGDSAKSYPTFALALHLFDDPSWEALSPERPLRYWRLIEINQPSGQPLITSVLRADERIVNYLKGVNYLDDRLSAMVSPMPADAQPDSKPPLQRQAEQAILARLKQMSSGQSPPVIQLTGRDSPSKELVANSVAGALSLRLYRMPASLLPLQAAEIESFARLWQRESLLLPAALYLDAQNIDLESPAGQAAGLLLARTRSLTILDTREAWPKSGFSSIAVETGKPSPGEQLAIWKDALGEAAGDIPAELTGQFHLGAAEIRRIAQEETSASAGSDARPLGDRLWAACLAATRPRLDGLAQHLEPKATWLDIVLPAQETNLLRQIAGQVNQRSRVYEDWGFAGRMSRGLGITALFAGESGTGKTMAAEVIANDLRLHLHRVDLSSVVSKYIGETEKNLRRLFDAAEDGGSILFFDEADALFGKRSEVKDSHDRYANIEVNYLLQRMESYRGLAILATNTKSALDPSFVRRLRFIVNFPFPGVVQRKAIWQGVFPAQTPISGLDFDRLARLNLTGGHIHNVGLNAAFRAAHAGSPVNMQMVLDAAREEFRKLERPIQEADFRWQGVA